MDIATSVRAAEAFRAFLRPLFRQPWVVYSKPPFGGPHHVLRYLARYTHRIAITNHRLVAFQNNQVTFRWRDYALANRKSMITLEASEFLRRFLLHVLPRGFMRIRFFGFLANRRRAALLPLCLGIMAIAAAFAALVNLPGIVGAFLAGLALNEAAQNKSATEKLGFLANSMFIPFFFLVTGFLIDPLVFAGSLVDTWDSPYP